MVKSFIQEAVWSRLTRTLVVLSVAPAIPLISPSSATLVQAQGIEVGGKFGLNRATVGGADVGDFGMRTGIAAGGFVTVMLGHFALQPELLYSLKGFQEELGLFMTSQGGVQSDELTTTLAYIEVPVHGSVLIPLSPGNAPRLRVSVGPSAAFRVSCTRTIHSTLFTPTGAFLGEASTELACDGIYKNTDFALMFAAGVDVPLAGGRVTADARYTLGLTSIGSMGFEVKNRVFAVLVGFGYRIRR